MDRQGIAAITACLIVLVVWWYHNDQEMKKLSAARAEQQAAVAAEQARLAPAPEPPKPAGTAPTASTTPAEQLVPEQMETLNTESADYTFTTHGGGIARALLKKHE